MHWNNVISVQSKAKSLVFESIVIFNVYSIPVFRPPDN